METQLDLFAHLPVAATPAADSVARSAPAPAPDTLSDAALIAALDDPPLAQAEALAEEAGRRRLDDGVGVLEALCRRFTGFGQLREVREQKAALHALAAIGTRPAAQAVARLIERQNVGGPGLAVALETAARLGVRLSQETGQALLRHEMSVIRAATCLCLRTSPSTAGLLTGLLLDPAAEVIRAAACALGRMGRTEVLPVLRTLLHDSPGEDVIGAVPPVADDDCVILLGRIARTIPSLAEAALDSLDTCTHVLAARVAADVRRRHGANICQARESNRQ